MDRDEALKLLRGGARGVGEWNRRRNNGEEIPSLEAADLKEADLRMANLSHANLSDANLLHANLSDANLSRANLSGAYLFWANVSRAKLAGADLANSRLAYTTIASVDLSAVNGLTEVRHVAASPIGHDTFYKSNGKLPTKFLEGCGIPDSLITYLPSLLGQSFEFYSCFISYSHKDEEFCERLHSRMRAEHLRVWYAPEDLKSGKKLRDQIDKAICLHDKLLIVLTEDSMRSDWVATEINRARQREVREGKRVLFPIRLVDFDAIQEWECFDADTGKDMARVIREYFIPDFTNWKDHDSFEEAFARLLRDLGADDVEGDQE